MLPRKIFSKIKRLKIQSRCNFSCTVILSQLYYDFGISLIIFDRKKLYDPVNVVTSLTANRIAISIDVVVVSNLKCLKCVVLG